MDSETTRTVATVRETGLVVRCAAGVRRAVAVVAVGAAVLLFALGAFDQARGPASVVERCAPRCAELLTVGEDPQGFDR